MRGSRRFSQAISEGESIALLAEVADLDSARTAEAEGAEGVVVAGRLVGVRDATELPILWKAAGSPAGEAHDAGADAYVLTMTGYEDDDGRLERQHAEALELGLDCVVEVCDEDELRLALDRVDPEILLVEGRDAEEDGGLEYVLGLLPDVPAGKLAVARVAAAAPEAVGELERAGVDAVIVRADDVSQLIGAGPRDL